MFDMLIPLAPNPFSGAVARSPFSREVARQSDHIPFEFGMLVKGGFNRPIEFIPVNVVPGRIVLGLVSGLSAIGQNSKCFNATVSARSLDPTAFSAASVEISQMTDKLLEESALPFDIIPTEIFEIDFRVHILLPATSRLAPASQS
jgi:hypothetical protein